MGPSCADEAFKEESWSTTLWQKHINTHNEWADSRRCEEERINNVYAIALNMA